jgi:ATP-dependent helicase/DNAse subunit B
MPVGSHDKRDTQWNMQYEKLVEYKRKKGNCLVPRSYEQDKTLGVWVSVQRTFQKSNRIRQDRKIILDEIGFVWKANRASIFTPEHDKLWHQNYEKLVKFKRKIGHCKVPRKYKEDKSLGIWVSNQQQKHANHTMRPIRTKLLDKIGFAWKYITLAARASTTNVRSLVI